MERIELMTPEQKERIDRMDIEDLLRIWRFAAPGTEPLLQGQCGNYFSERMFGLRDKDNAAWVRASKSLGWDR
jgi:hypothetical protein